MNCMAVRYGEMLILDAGMGFPEETAYGVDGLSRILVFLTNTRTTLPRLSSRTGMKIISCAAAVPAEEVQRSRLLFTLHRRPGGKQTRRTRTARRRAAHRVERATSSISASSRSSSYAFHTRSSTASHSASRRLSARSFIPAITR